MTDILLAVPDVANGAMVPPGWFEFVAAPIIEAIDDWEELDETDARIHAMASYIESLDPDEIAFEQAKRLVEKRRGDLLGSDVTKGERTDLKPRFKVDVNASAMTVSNWRKLARHWDDLLWPVVIEATSKRDISQTKLLKLVSKLTGEPPPPLPTGTFNVIVADPPWRYEFAESSTREIENQYPTMALDDICNLKPPAAEDAILYLWATSPKLTEALQVMDKWGFNYRTCLVWVKDKIGMGYYARQRHELILIGVKGTPGVPEPENRFDSVIEAPRTEHSRKPERLYDIIEAGYPNGTYLEMFARRPREGWESWGNEA